MDVIFFFMRTVLKTLDDLSLLVDISTFDSLKHSVLNKVELLNELFLQLLIIAYLPSRRTKYHIAGTKTCFLFCRM